MYSALKAAAVTICCMGWAMAGSARADQTPATDLSAATAQKADTVLVDDQTPSNNREYPQIDAARAKLAYLKVEASRKEQLFADQAISAGELEQAKLDVAMAQKQLELAQQGDHQIQFEADPTLVRKDRNGDRSGRDGSANRDDDGRWQMQASKSSGRGRMGEDRGERSRGEWGSRQRGGRGESDMRRGGRGRDSMRGDRHGRGGPDFSRGGHGERGFMRRGQGRGDFSRGGRGGADFMHGRRGGPGATHGGPDFMRGGFARGGPKVQIHVQAERANGQTQPKGVVLGVAVSNPDAELRSQLDLPDGIGLVVQQVLPNTLAASSGLKQYDVLQKIDDQLVVNTDQVSVLIRMHKPGDKITFTVVRHGKSQELSSTIAKPRTSRPGSMWGGNRFGHRGSNMQRGPRPSNAEPPPTRDRNDATPPQPTTPQTAAPATQPSGSASASATDVLRQFADLFVD